MHSDDMNGQRDGLYEREVQRLLGMKNSVHDLVVKNVEETQDGQKRNYDKKHGSTKVDTSHIFLYILHIFIVILNTY